MGKRKHRDKNSYLEEKIRRLEERLRYHSSDSSEESYRSDYSRYDSDTPAYEGRAYAPYSDESDAFYTERPKSPVVVLKTILQKRSCIAETTPNVNLESTSNAKNPPPAADPGTSSTATEKTLTSSDDILAALGDPKGKDEVLGPKIPEEIAERWGRIIVEGLTKEQKNSLLEKLLIPENFTLLKAPQMNPEIAAAVNETCRNRDKSLEKFQQCIGIGIAGLSNLTSLLIKGDVDKLEILRKISETGQVLLDLHYDTTAHRRKLAASCLDKNFGNIVKDIKRDAFLFGANLGEKIKSSKSAEKSGLQVKRGERNAHNYKKFTQRENWRGPPRKHEQRPRRQGGPRNRYYGHTSRRPPPAADRPSTSSKTNARNPKT